MNPKSFLFIGLWIQPIKALPLGQRWNVMEAETAHEDTYVNACNVMHPDAPYDIISESVSVSRSVSVPISEKKSTSSSGVRVRETTGVAFMPNNMLPCLLVMSKLCNFAV